MDIEAAFELAKRSIVVQTGKSLIDSQKFVLQGIIEGKKLREITDLHRYNDSYVKQISASLCKYLSAAFGEPVNKDNIRSVLEQRLRLEQRNPEPVVIPDQEIVTTPAVVNSNFVFDLLGRDDNVASNWTEYNENIWVGRIEQSEALCQKILGDCRIAIILGITGIGKTALAERVAEQTKQKWDQIVRINFDDIKVSESFLEATNSMLSQFGISPTTEDYKKTDGLLELLVYNVQSRQVLLIIDSLEFILGENKQGEQTLKDATWQDFFKRLLTANRCNGRIILTSQILPNVLEQIASRYTQYFSKSVMSGLNNLEQLELFAKACLDISENSESCTYLRRMGAIYEGHPLSLRTIIGEIQELCFGNVLAYWEQYSEEFEMVERDIINADSCSISEDKWKINRLSLSMENKVQYRLQQTFFRLKNSCYLAYCLLCEASIFRGVRLEKQWTNQLKERGDLSQELSDHEIREALNKLYAWYLVESEVQKNKRYIRLHNLVRSVALEHLNDLP